MEIFEIGNKEPLYIDKFQCVYNNGFGIEMSNVIVNTYPPKNFSKEDFIKIKEEYKRKGINFLTPVIYEKKNNANNKRKENSQKDTSIDGEDFYKNLNKEDLKEILDIDDNL